MLSCFPAGALNPFGAAVVRSPWDSPPPIDVPGINRAPGDQILRVLEGVRADPEDSQAIMLLGPEGVGKTHMLSRLRMRLPAGTLLACGGPSSPGRWYRDLLGQVTGDLARRGVDDGTDQLSALVARALASNDNERRWPAAYLAELTNHERLWRQRLNARLIDVQEQFEAVDTEVLDHILRLPFEPAARRDMMWWWLSGSPLPVEQYYALGLDGNIEEEAQAKDVFHTICALAASCHTPLVLAFDHLESVREHPEFAGKLAKRIIEMEDEIPSLLMVLACRTRTWSGWLEPVLGARYLGDTQRVVQLESPGKAQAVALARARSGIQGLSPLTESDVESAWAADPRPRAILSELSIWWSSAQADPTAPNPAPHPIGTGIRDGAPSSTDLPSPSSVPIPPSIEARSGRPMPDATIGISLDSEDDEIALEIDADDVIDDIVDDGTHDLEVVVVDEEEEDIIVEEPEEGGDTPDDATVSMNALTGHAGLMHEAVDGLLDEFEEDKTIVMQIVEAFEDEIEDEEGYEFDPEILDEALIAEDTSDTDAEVWALLDSLVEETIGADARSTFDVDDALPPLIHAISVLGDGEAEDAATTNLPRDVLAVLRHNDVPMIIAYGNQGSGSSFAYRIKWLLAQARSWRPREPDFRAIFLRDEDMKIPKGWKRGREYVEELSDVGGSFLRVSSRERAVLELARRGIEGELELEMDRTRVVIGVIRWPTLFALPLIEALFPPPAGVGEEEDEDDTSDDAPVDATLLDLRPVSSEPPARSTSAD